MKKRILENAAKHIFSTGIKDGATSLSVANMQYGLAKMHFMLEHKGYEPNATFISTPDETITRNVGRWEQGFSYGGKISWGNGKEKLIVLDTKPNVCGMLVAGLNDIPDPKKIIKRISDINKNSHSAYGVEIKWDFYKGNHFIDIFEVEPLKTKQKLPKYAVILHAGCLEFKSDIDGGPGLYWDKSKILKEICEKVKTPFGDVHILTGSMCKNYMKVHNRAEKFAKKRREIAYKEIFDCKKIISNITHQGLLNMNEIRLGCQHIESKSTLYPVSIRADLPSFLMHGKSNFSPEIIEDLGFNERSRELGVYKRLRNANIMPHGGGYFLEDSLSVKKIFEIGYKRFFDIQMVDGVGRKIVSNMRELQFAYRDTRVVQRTEDLKLAEKAAILNPIYTLKV